MEEQLKRIKAKFVEDLKFDTSADALRSKYLARKSELSRFMRSIKDLPDDKRKEIGSAANQLRREITDALAKKVKGTQERVLDIDVTLPGRNPYFGVLHPVTKVERDLRGIFSQMGFVAIEGPEIETDYFNFEALNIPKGHPARDMHDTFYIDDSSLPVQQKQQTYLLRTHISPMQIRTMKRFIPSFSIISSGRVFRREATDARHEHTWDYMEGFVVGEKISLANLRFVLLSALRQFFDSKVNIKLRPSYFPFVEPGVEVAMSCIFCKGAGCKVCTTGWLEMLGAGMIHPNLFKIAGYPAGKYTGFAFGLGLSRFAMMKYNISDIRLLYKNDLRYHHPF